MRMGSRYGHAWASQYGTRPDGIAAAEWRSTLAGLTTAQIREGFNADASRGDKFPPSSPYFKAMCYGIPSLASVRAEISDMSRGAGQGPIISRFARGVWSRIGGYDYRNSDAKRADYILRDAYELTREFVMNGGTLPVDPTALIESPKRSDFVPAPPEVAKAHLDKIAELLRTEPVKPYSEVE